MPYTAFRAGGGMTDLTPDRVLPNYNGAPVKPDPEACPLRCHAVAFDDGETQGAIVSCDTTFVDRTLLLAIRDACARATGLPAAHVMLGATHSHAAPATCPSFLSGALPDPLYVDFFVEQIVTAVRQAWENLTPAVLVSGTCPAPGFEFNRRLLRPGGMAVMSGTSNADPSYPPAGPVDREMPFVAFETLCGHPIAFVTNYACHNNCVSEVYSGDLGGRIGDALRGALGAEIPTPFLEAPCGDVIWRPPEGGRLRGDALAREIGRAAAERLTPAYREGSRKPVARVTIRREVLEIPDRVWEESTFCRDDCRGDDEKARTFARRRYDPEEAAVKARGRTVCPVEIMGMSFGDTAIVTNPAKLFVTFGVEIRKRSPFAVTLVSELTNGYCGYVGTEQAFEEQGYETHRTVYTCRLAKDGGRRIAERSAAMLERLQDGQVEKGKGGP